MCATEASPALRSAAMSGSRFRSAFRTHRARHDPRRSAVPCDLRTRSGVHCRQAHGCAISRRPAADLAESHERRALAAWRRRVARRSLVAVADGYALDFKATRAVSVTTNATTTSRTSANRSFNLAGRKRLTMAVVCKYAAASGTRPLQRTQ